MAHKATRHEDAVKHSVTKPDFEDTRTVLTAPQKRLPLSVVMVQNSASVALAYLDTTASCFASWTDFMDGAARMFLANTRKPDFAAQLRPR